MCRCSTKCCRLTAVGAEQPTSWPGLCFGPAAGTVAVGRAYQMLIWERHWYLLRLRIALGEFFPVAEGRACQAGGSGFSSCSQLHEGLTMRGLPGLQRCPTR
jgi:hypothetical protein